MDLARDGIPLGIRLGIRLGTPHRDAPVLLVDATLGLPALAHHPLDRHALPLLTRSGQGFGRRDAHQREQATRRRRRLLLLLLLLAATAIRFEQPLVQLRPAIDQASDDGVRPDGVRLLVLLVPRRRKHRLQLSDRTGVNTSGGGSSTICLVPLGVELQEDRGDDQRNIPPDFDVALVLRLILAPCRFRRERQNPLRLRQLPAYVENPRQA